MKLRTLLASSAAILTTAVIAVAGFNSRQTDTGAFCLQESSGTGINDRWCIAANGLFDITPSTTADSAATNDYHEIAATTPVDTTGTNTHNLLTLDLDIGNATGGTNAARGLQIDAITGDAQVTTVGVNIGAMTGTAGTENGVVVGAGWDAGILSSSDIELLVGDLIVGNGVPSVTQNGEDAYIEGTLEVDGNVTLDSTTVTINGTLVDVEQYSVPIVGQCKVGATAGWVITAGTNISHATLPAAQTGSTLVCPLPAIPVGSTITAVAVAGQVESAGNTVTMTLDLRRLTNAAADNTDASVTTDTLDAGVTADTILSASNLGISAQSEVIATDESHYVLITGTTAAATDIDLTHLLVTFTSG